MIDARLPDPDRETQVGAAGGPGGGRTRLSLLRNPAGWVPSGTSIRFAVFVLAIIASTGSIFGYLWQVAQPSVQARMHRCLSTPLSGPLARAVKRLAAAPPMRSFAVGACVRPAGPELTAWFLAGIAVLAAVAAALYWITPWWMIRVGRPASWGRLAPLDPARDPGLDTRLDELVIMAGCPGPRAFLVDEGAIGTIGGRAFGRQGRSYIRLDLGLVVKRREPVFTDVVLHELAHLRNRDIRPTYLTIAAWRGFVAVIAVGYLAALAISHRRPSVPGSQALVAIAVLVALVLLSTRAVLRAREAQADAVAADCHPDGVLRTVLDAAAAPAPPVWRRGLRFHFDPVHRAALLRDPGGLFGADAAAMFAAGIAIAVTVSDLTPAIFAAILASPLGMAAALTWTSGNHPLYLVLLTYGTPALFIAIPIAALSCATTWRLQYRAAVDGVRVRLFVMRLAAAAAGGMVVGARLGLENALAGTWGVVDTSVARDLAVVALSAALLLVVLAVLVGWASECAAAWLVGGQRFPRRAWAGAALLGTLGLAPALLAWNTTQELPLSLQLLRGPDRSQRPFVGDWPAASAVFFHSTQIGVFDIVPGNVLLVALPFLFVAAGALRRARPGAASWRPAALPPPVVAASPVLPVSKVLLAGVAGALVSLAVVLPAMLALRLAIGRHPLSLAGASGLIYLTRVSEAVIAAGAGGAAAWAAWRAPGYRLTSAILAALVTAVGAAVCLPQLLYIGELGWPHRAVNPIDNVVLYGLIGTLGASRAILAAIAVVAVGGAFHWVTTAVRGQVSPAHAGPSRSSPSRGGPAPAAQAAVPGRDRLAAVLLAALLLGGSAAAAYYYLKYD